MIVPKAAGSDPESTRYWDKKIDDRKEKIEVFIFVLALVFFMFCGVLVSLAI